MYGSSSSARDQVFIVDVQVDGDTRYVNFEAARGHRAAIMVIYGEPIEDCFDSDIIPKRDGVYRFDCSIVDSDHWTDCGWEHATEIDGVFTPYGDKEDDNEAVRAWYAGYTVGFDDGLRAKIKPTDDFEIVDLGLPSSSGAFSV
jgi:hypothetical protein